MGGEATNPAARVIVRSNIRDGLVDEHPWLVLFGVMEKVVS